MKGLHVDRNTDKDVGFCSGRNKIRRTASMYTVLETGMVASLRNETELHEWHVSEQY